MCHWKYGGNPAEIMVQSSLGQPVALIVDERAGHVQRQRGGQQLGDAISVAGGDTAQRRSV